MVKASRNGKIYWEKRKAKIRKEKFEVLKGRFVKKKKEYQPIFFSIKKKIIHYIEI